MARGLFIAFEGIDGCGKDTQLNNAKERYGTLLRTSEEPMRTTTLGARIQAILDKDPNVPKPTPDLLQEMFIRNRGEHISLVVMPDILNGHNHLTSRYAHSTIAYGMLSGKSIDFFLNLHQEILGAVMTWPTLTFIFDLPAEIAITRKVAGGGKPQLFEKLELLEKVRKNYLELDEHPYFNGSIVVVNSNQPPDAVFAEIASILDPLLFMVRPLDK